ncbi:MAG: hypothetical protein Q7R85_01500 [bacterium]|nr:hypothetical protein [bacterium]
MTDIHKKPFFKQRAVALRRQGLSYSEILREVPVAKSTLGVWLHDVGLSKTQKQRLTDKKLASARRGAAIRHANRLATISRIHAEAAKDIINISERELFLIGVALYWAEGAKEKDYQPGSRIAFSNSDPRMIKLFLRWLSAICRVPADQLVLEIYIHESAANTIPSVTKYWATATGFDQSSFTRIYYKKNKLRTNRKRVGNDYFGLLRIRVKRSSSLNRKIEGWINAIVRCTI